MTVEASEKTVWRIEVANEAETGYIAQDVAGLLQPDDIVTLIGDLGAGKTTFARALIRALTGDPTLEAPSPTFTLMQTYEAGERVIVHADLYRIDSGAQLADLGWEEAIEGAIALVEWPERAPEYFEGSRLAIRLSYADPDKPESRRITISAWDAFGPRLAKFKVFRDLLRDAGFGGAKRSFLQGDASSRAYETLEGNDGARAILMISPPRPDGPPIRYGKSYSTIARLAETVKPFVAIAEGLRTHGLSSPEILAQNLDEGLLVVEDFGREGVVDDNGPIAERYLEAAGALAHLHAQALPDSTPIDANETWYIPPYDLDALLIEVELIADWYAGHIAKTVVPSGARAVFVNLWRQALLEISGATPTWTLRDYHSPNLIWLAEREGVRRVGIIDFQDCVLGHPAYDVASLGQDARVTVPDDLEIRLLAHYARLRREADPAFDMADFARAYSILGAQRATKVLGIFARLDQRDGKPAYLAHIPRVEAYLRKCLRHPALAEIKAWYETSLPTVLAAR